jgi:hypothetical protein
VDVAVSVAISAVIVIVPASPPVRTRVVESVWVDVDEEVVIVVTVVVMVLMDSNDEQNALALGTPFNAVTTESTALQNAGDVALASTWCISETSCGCETAVAVMATRRTDLR